MSGTSLSQATYRISEHDLEYMVLTREDMPAEFQGYQVVQEGELDNATLAERGFHRKHA